MDTNRKLTDITDKKPRTPSYKYSSRLNEEQHIRFNELLCKAGSEHNRSRFIVKSVAQNYNQVVKAINAHFSNVAIPHQIAVLEQRTRELKALSIEILNLVKKAAQ